MHINLRKLYYFCVIIISIVISIFLSFVINKNLKSKLIVNPKLNINFSNHKNFDNNKAMWVSYLDLDISSDTNTEQKFKEKFDNIIEKAKEFNINIIVAHVRSHGDAFYKSEIFPWSHFLTGVQGQNPNFDPLEYMIEKSHENNLKFHAWINPLRVKSSKFPENFSENNPFYKFDPEEHFLYHTDGICYNPGFQEVRDLITDGVAELVKNYNIDAVHFDDYFYPETKNMLKLDKLNITNETETRQKNITKLIEQIYNKIKTLNPDIEFGVSPPGNIDKCAEIGINLNDWCQKKIVDYICPQIYWSLDFDEMPFENTARKWKNIVNNKQIKLYCGLALYKIGTNLDNNTWTKNKNILVQEAQILKKLNFDGVFLYSYKQMCNSHEEINLLKDFLCKST